MSTSASASTSSTITRGKWSVVGTIVSAPIRGYYYPGKVIAIKKSIIDTPVAHNNNPANGGSSSTQGSNNINTSNQNNQNTPIAAVSPLIYSIQFSDPLDASPLEMDNNNLSETNKIDSKRQQDQGLIKDYNADQLIGRGFEPITRALLSENQKVFITYRSRECSAHVIKHDTVLDDVTLLIDHPPNSTTTTINGCCGGFGDLTLSSSSSSSLSNNHHLNGGAGGGREIRTVKLNEIRLLPSRKSGRIQEPPDYSLLANNGRRSPDEEYSNVAKLSSSLNSNSITNGSMSSSSSLSSTNAASASTKNNNRRQRTVSGSSILANHDTNLTTTTTSSSSIFANNNGPTNTMMHSQSAHIDVPQQRRLPTSYQQQLQQNNAHITLPGRKRRPTTTTAAAAATAVAATTASTFYNNNNNNTAGSISTSSSFTDHHQNVSTADVVMSGPMDECTAALVLMSLSAPPRSPTLFNQTEPKRATKLYKCTWPGCKHQTYSSKEIQQHVRFAHKQNDDEEMESGEEDFYYTEVDASEPIGFFNHPNVAAAFNHHHHHHNNHQLSSGPESPVSLSEADAASSSSSSSQLMMAIGDNSMDSSSNPPSPITTLMAQQQQHQLQNHQQFNQSAATFMPLQNKYRHLEDHEYNRKPDPAGISLLGTGTVVSNRRGRKSNLNNQNGVSIITPTAHHQTTIISSHPINIPNMEQHHDNTSQSPISGSASFGTGGMIGGFNSAASSLSSGFGSYTSSLGSSFSPISPTRSHSGSLSSSASGKYARISNAFITATNGGGGGGRSNGSINGGTPLSSSQSSTASSHHHHNNVQQPNRTSPTKRVRGETRKCRKVYGMEKKDSWCTQCKWKKACSRFTD